MTMPTAAERPVTTASESAVRRPLERVLRGLRALGLATRASVFRMSADPIWTESALADKTSIDYLVKELRDTAPDKPYIFHLGAQAHVGESWHRPYETVMANTVGTLNLLQSVVDHGLELEKFDTAGTSEEYGNPREAVAHHHDFDPDGGLILHERSPINPKSIYATAKVAADFLTMNYHDAYGVPGVVTRMFNNYGPRQNPRYVTGTIVT